MKKIILLAALSCMFLLTGCGINSALTRNANVTQTNINLERNNYRVVGDVEGEAKATYIVGIGGLSPKALKENAQADMIRNANLTGSQAIINANVRVHRQVYTPLYMIVTVSAYGQVIEFTE